MQWHSHQKSRQSASQPFMFPSAFCCCNCAHNSTFESGKIWQRLPLLSTFVYFCRLVGKLWQTCLKTATSATPPGTLSPPHTCWQRANDPQEGRPSGRVSTRHFSSSKEKNFFSLSPFTYSHSLVSRGTRMAKDDSHANGQDRDRESVDICLVLNEKEPKTV